MVEPNPYCKVSRSDCGSTDFACFFCSYRPNTNSGLHSQLLYDFLSKEFSSSYYYDFFQTLGIVTDNHLRILLGMNKDDRSRFLGRYVPSRLTPFGYVQLLSWIEEFRNEHPGISTMVVRRKHPKLEAFLAMPGTRPELVARSMRLPVEEYEGFVDRIEEELDNQRGCKLEEIVEAICDDMPIFAAYEEAWPVKVILKRLLGEGKRIPCRLSNSCSGRPSFQQRKHQCPRLAQYLHYHGHKVAPAAKKLLRLLRMEEELAPALWLLNVDTDARYEKIKSYKREKKYEFLREMEKLELNPIQRFALETIFEF
ncbi:hypothetical protein FB45DRAFT_167515 [Roridomyces roridus]|uniref:Uncharacterized protein n=1 Tax=Roridomyces roridus TaxID=1738132 RepID=A0AAD7FG50_9AGAR|nr:hypothetical protein FB45DRAFT_167515 [Roridomyces roridus]